MHMYPNCALTYSESCSLQCAPCPIGIGCGLLSPNLTLGPNLLMPTSPGFLYGQFPCPLESTNYRNVYGTNIIIPSSIKQALYVSKKTL